MEFVDPLRTGSNDRPCHPLRSATRPQGASQLRYTTGVLFDRMRLCAMVQDRDMSSFAEHRFMARWTEEEIELVRAELTAPPKVTKGRAKPKLARRRRPRKVAAGATAAEPAGEVVSDGTDEPSGGNPPVPETVPTPKDDEAPEGETET
jgi:hypothetical protein